MTETSLLLWTCFAALIFGAIAFDLGVFNRRSHRVGTLEAVITSLLWVMLAMLFAGLVYVWRGTEMALEFIAGYLLEKSLSLDNLFVFYVVFQTFDVPLRYQHRILFWGVLSALALRGALIFAGFELIEHFHYALYALGAVVLWTGFHMFRATDEIKDLKKSWIVKFMRTIMPMTARYHGQHFFAKIKNRYMATPLVLVLLLIEGSDVIFAFDSIPAIFAVTLDPMIVYTSNIFAILGLRSLYFLLADMAVRFQYVRPALAIILIMVGLKMLLQGVISIPTAYMLSAIGIILCASVLLSLRRTKEYA